MKNTPTDGMLFSDMTGIPLGQYIAQRRIIDKNYAPRNRKKLMQHPQITVEQLVEIAEAFELGDPIDWGMLSVNEHDAYLFLASGVLENYNSADPSDREIMMLASVVKLTVENFVLNIRLNEKHI